MTTAANPITDPEVRSTIIPLHFVCEVDPSIKLRESRNFISAAVGVQFAFRHDDEFTGQTGWMAVPPSSSSIGNDLLGKLIAIAAIPI